VNLTLPYNVNVGCHSRESGNPAEKTGFPRIKYGAGLIKSGMTVSVQQFLNHYTSYIRSSLKGSQGWWVGSSAIPAFRYVGFPLSLPIQPWRRLG
jgi:hypothetical protein